MRYSRLNSAAWLRRAASTTNCCWADKQAAEISLHTDVGLLASDLAERIVGEQLTDTALSARVIDRFLDELEKAPARARRADAAGYGAVR